MKNYVFLIGNLGKDVEVRTFDSGSKKSSVSLATNKNYKDSSGEWITKTEWHNIVAWGEYVTQTLSKCKKGQLIAVEGEISTRSYENESGETRYITEIIAQKVIRLSRENDPENASSEVKEEVKELPPLGSVPGVDNLPF
jgi:single-strand DNA-binding protein